ncbi:MAG: protein phosphatase CheZ [Pseudomonadota bacterium]
MAAPRLFRIEQTFADHTHANDEGAGTLDRHREVMAAIGSVRGLLEKGASASVEVEAPAVEPQIFEQYRREMTEALKLKAELDSIYEAIHKTKREIATLHHSGLEGADMHRVTDELDAIVGGTEKATESILSAAEAIDDNANSLSAKLDGDDQGMAIDIQDQVIKVFEACNFQDLTGQRITKVVTALQFIEERVNSMMNIWGGMESFSDIEPVAPAAGGGDAALLNGPALDSDEDVASQDDIDALFD